MDTDSFIILMKTKDFYKDIANDVEKLFDKFNYDENYKRPLPILKNKKVIDLFKDELGGNIMKELVAIRAKTWSYLMDDDTEYEKANGTKKCVIKRRFMFENYTDSLFNDKIILVIIRRLMFEKYTDSLFNDKIILKSQQRSKRDYHNVYTEQINKIKDCKHVIKSQCIHTEQMHLKYAIVRY